MKAEIETDRHYAVGPYTDVYGHGPVTLVNDINDDGTVERSIVVCLDCGYVAADIRHLTHEECGRQDNPITQTWRERLEKEGIEGALEDAPDP